MSYGINIDRTSGGVCPGGVPKFLQNVLTFTNPQIYYNNLVKGAQDTMYVCMCVCVRAHMHVCIYHLMQ